MLNLLCLLAFLPACQISEQDELTHVVRFVDDEGEPYAHVPISYAFLEGESPTWARFKLEVWPRSTDEHGRLRLTRKTPWSKGDPSLQFTLRGPSLRGHTSRDLEYTWDGRPGREVVRFARPGALRIEVEGPGPISHAHVWVEGATGRWANGRFGGSGDRHEVFVEAEPGGILVVEGLSPGTFEVEVRRGTARDTQTVTVNAGRTTDARFAPVGEGRWLRGVVTDGDGRPLEGVVVSREHVPASTFDWVVLESWPSVTTGPSGEFNLGMEDAGWHLIEAGWPRRGGVADMLYTTPCGEALVCASRAAEGPMEVRCSPRPFWQELRVRVEGELGQPLPGVGWVHTEARGDGLGGALDAQGKGTLDWFAPRNPGGVRERARILVNGHQLASWPAKLEATRREPSAEVRLPAGSISVESLGPLEDCEGGIWLQRSGRAEPWLDLTGYEAVPRPRVRVANPAGVSPRWPVSFVGLRAGSYVVTASERGTRARAFVELREGERTIVRLAKAPQVEPRYLLDPVDQVPVEPATVHLARADAPLIGGYRLGRVHHALAFGDGWAGEGSFVPDKSGEVEVVLRGVETGDVDVTLTLDGLPFPSRVTLGHSRGHELDGEPFALSLLNGEPLPEGTSRFVGLPEGDYRVWARGLELGAVRVEANRQSRAHFELGERIQATR